MTNISSFSGNLISFPDCPNHCVRGKVYNPYTHVSTICEYCASKRKSAINSEIKDEDNRDLSEILNIPKSHWGTNYDFDNVLPPKAQDLFQRTSVAIAKEEIEKLMGTLSTGTEPDHSYLINLGLYIDVGALVYPMLMKAYAGGLTVAPFLSLADIGRLRTAYEENKTVTSGGYERSYSDFIDSQVCVLLHANARNPIEQNLIRAIVYERAVQNKSTIIISTAGGNYSWAVSDVLDTSRYNPQFIQIKFLSQDNGSFGIVT